MVYEVVAVRDRALACYGRPFCVVSLGSAIRSFVDEINRAHDENPFYKHPEDHDLFHLGRYNEETGRFENLEVPVQVAVGKQCVILKEA